MIVTKKAQMVVEEINSFAGVTIQGEMKTTSITASTPRGNFQEEAEAAQEKC
jgi:hypothetical protein